MANDALKEYLNSQPDFVSLSDEDKGYFMDAMNDPETRNEYINSRPGYQSLQPEDKKEFLSAITGSEEPGIIYQLGKRAASSIGMSYTNAARMYQDVRQSLGAAAPIFGMLPPQGPEFENEVSNQVVNWKNYFNENIKETEDYKASLNTPAQLLFDTAAFALDSAPETIGSIVSGTMAPALITGVAKGVANTYDRMKDAGYSTGASLARGMTTGAIQGLVTKWSIGQALDVGKPLLKRYFQSALTDLGGGFVAGGTEVVTDYALDRMYADKDNGLLDPTKGFWDHFKQVAWNTTAQMGSGVFNVTTGELYHRAFLHVNGLKRVDIGNDDFYVAPKEIADEMEPSVKDLRTQFPDLSAQEAANTYMNARQAQQTFNEEIVRIQKDIETKPLKTEPDIDPQAKPKPVTGELTSGQEVGLSPEYLTSIGQDPSLPLNETLPVKIVKVNGPKVDVQMDSDAGPQLYADVPREFLKPAPRAPISGGNESPFMVEMARRILTPDKLYGAMTPTEIKLSMGHWMQVNFGEEMDALGQFKGGKNPRAKMVYDAMLNNPDQALRIFSHEFGHQLAEMTPAAAQKFGLEGMENFREFADFDNLRKYAEADRELYQDIMIELNESYGSWALYPDEAALFKFDPKTGEAKGGKPKELLANAISLFLHDPKEPLTFRGQPVNWRDSKLYKYFQDFMQQNDKVRNAYDLMRYSSETPDAGLRATVRAQKAAGEVIKARLQAKRDATDLTPWEYLNVKLRDNLYAFMSALRHSDKAIDIADAYRLAPAMDGEYVKAAVDGAIRLKQMGIHPDDYSAALELLNISKARFRTIRFVKPGGRFATMGDYEEGLGQFKTDTRKKLIESGLTGDKLEDTIRSAVKDFDSESVFTKDLQLVSPGLKGPAEAADQLAQINAKYADLPGLGGKSAVQAIEEVKSTWHKAFKDWILPQLKDSGQFDPTLLKYFEDNDDYVHFDFVAHDNDTVEILPRTGGMGNISDPFGATLDLHIRLAAAARKAGLYRDLLTMIADSDTPAAVDQVYRVSGDAEVPMGFEKIRTKKYNEATGMMEDTYFAARKKYAEAFKSVAEQSAFSQFFNQSHNYLKGWYTVYNPGFWLTNFLRDITRSVVNVPLTRGKELGIITEAIKQVVSPDKDLYNQMVREKVLLGGGDYFAGTADMLPGEKHIARTSGDPFALTKAWKDVDGVFETLRFLGERSGALHFGKQALTPNPIKLFGAASDYMKFVGRKIGGRTEFASKAAVYKFMQKNYGGKMSDEQIRWVVRNAAGTPMLSRRGEWSPVLSNLFMFYNPNMQGLASDLQLLATDPRKAIASGALVKRVAASTLYNGALFAALTGALDAYIDDPESDAPKNQWQTAVTQIPIRDLLRGLPLVHGFTQDGETAYTLIPFDPVTEMINSAIFSTMAASMNALNEEKIAKGEKPIFDPSSAPAGYDFKQAAGDVITNVGDRLALSPSPFIQLGIDAYRTAQTLGTRKNSLTNYMNVEVVPERVFKSDDTKEKLKYIGRHFWNMGLLGPITAVYRIPYESKTLTGARGGEENKALTQLGDFAKIPGMSSTLGRFFKTSKSGYNDWYELRTRSERGAKQTQRNQAQELVRQLVNNPKMQLTKENMETLMLASGTAKYELNKLVPLLNIAKQDARLIAPFERILYANDKAERAKAIIEFNKKRQNYQR